MLEIHIARYKQGKVNSSIQFQILTFHGMLTLYILKRRKHRLGLYGKSRNAKQGLRLWASTIYMYFGFKKGGTFEYISMIE